MKNLTRYEIYKRQVGIQSLRLRLESEIIVITSAEDS